MVDQWNEQLELINGPFLKEGGTPDQYRTAWVTKETAPARGATGAVVGTCRVGGGTTRLTNLPAREAFPPDLCFRRQSTVWTIKL